MKLQIAVFACLLLSLTGLAQDRVGKQIDQTGQVKYKFVYKKQKMAEGVSVALPQGFRQMTDGEMKQEYPNFHKPVIMMTSEDGVADFGYNISFNQWGRNLKLLKEFMKANNSYYFKDIQYLQDTISNLDGRDFVVLEFVSYTQNKETDRELPPIRTYSYMMYTVEDNRILVFNYTCPARYMDKWKQAAPRIMASVDIKSGLDLTNATTQIPKKTKGKKPTDLVMKTKGSAKPKADKVPQSNNTDTKGKQ
jgi:hypothetical protein